MSHLAEIRRLLRAMQIGTLRAKAARELVELIEAHFEDVLAEARAEAGKGA